MGNLTSSQPALLIGLMGIAVFLLFALLNDRYDRRRFGGGDITINRLRLYNRTMIIQLALAMLCVASWQLAGHDLASLGFRRTYGMQAWTSLGLTAVALAYLVFSLIRTAKSRKVRDKVRRQITSAGKLDLIRPTKPSEHRRFRWVALIAGVTEEIIFRGFLIGAIALAAPLWVAAVSATVLFALAHVYQGIAGMLRVLPFSAALTLLFVIGGSLWTVMLLHVAADLVGGEILRLADHHAVADTAKEQT